MGNKFNQFLLLMWKNWTLAKRSPCKIVFEIIIPVVLFLIISTRFGAKIEKVPTKNFSPFRATDSNSLCAINTSIAVAPQSKVMDQIVESISRECPKIIFTSYNDSQEMEKGIYLNDFNAAIQLDDSFKNMNENITLPSDLKVTIRMKSGPARGDGDAWYTDEIYSKDFGLKPRAPDTNTSGIPVYQERGFLLLQQLITLAFVNYNKSEKLDITIHKYPYTSYEYDVIYGPFYGMMFIPTVAVLSFVLNYHNLVTAIASEKEQQLKESMKAMGLSGWLQWLTWFIRGFITLLIAIVVVVVLLKVRIIGAPLLRKTNGKLLFIILLFFACSLITSTFLTSVFFSKASTAIAIGNIAFIFSGFPYMLFTMEIFQKTTGVSVLANSAIGFAMLLMIQFEESGEGAQWSNLWKPASPEHDDLTLGSVMLWLFFDIFLYLFIALYVEAIFPGKFGVPKPWYFPVQHLLVCRNNKIDHVTDEPETSKNEEEFFEKFTDRNIPKGIELKKLTKTFRGRSVVKNVSLDIYEGHITVLMGHNGAGKTTIISMITGMFPPTKGTVTVNGHDVRTNVEKARESMGLCLQHNVLFNDLTVKEHLYFFSKLKRLRGKEIKAEINNYLKLLELEDKKDKLSATLSGGMKRKLSVALALCGKSKVVLLDEPTSGLDPSARKSVWNLILKEKKERTILLTTHFMDEADTWGDRIAIITSGMLQCCGTSFFLKKKYGTGYLLIMEVSPKCVTQSVTNLLRFYIPQVKIYSRVGTELTYQLPESETVKFENMLTELESRSSALGILSYGISSATLEQVFLKTGANQNDRTVTQKPTAEDKRISENSYSYLKGFQLLCNQFFAVFLKKWLSTLRNWKLFLVQIIVVILFLCPVNVKIDIASDNVFEPLKLNMDPYTNPVTLISGNKTNPFYINYRSVLSKQGKILEVTNISKTILDLMNKYPQVVRSSYVVGASFNDNVTTAWFNGDPYHSEPLALGLVLNAIYSHHLGVEKSITFVNHPLPLNLKLQMKQPDLFGLVLMFGLGWLLTFVVSFYVLFYVKERISKSKHLQYASGMNVFIFWLTAFLFDFIMFIIIIVLIIIMILIATAVTAVEDKFSMTLEDLHELGLLGLVLVSFGFSVLPLVYLISQLCSSPAYGFVIISLLGSFVGVGGALITYLLQYLLNANILKVFNYVFRIFVFIPFYMVCKSILDLYTISSLKFSCSEFATPKEYCEVANVKKCCDIKDFLSMESPGIGYNLLISFIMFVLLFIILIINDFGLFTFIINDYFSKKKLPIKIADMDNDVNQENQKIKSTSLDVLNTQYCLVLRDVTKYYNGLLAVNGLCLGVKSFECFGLLGVNGAGKTTTFKMLTGDTSFSYGDAWVNGFSIKSQRRKVAKLIGYCPQFDALLDHLTARETVKIFALIRGIPRKRCKEVVEELAQKLDFYEHIDKQVKNLSGGTKRKLSLALALVGDPPIIYLDEPTTGIDPISKTRIWSYIRELRDAGKCIILTSHSMEECEVLCTKVVIMVNGTFRCLGSVQHIKSKFAQGYFLTVNITESDSDDYVTAVEKFIKKHFPEAELQERFQDILTYQLPSSSMRWSQIFGLFERNKKQLNIKDYSIGQCSLDQVFLSFAKY